MVYTSFSLRMCIYEWEGDQANLIMHSLALPDRSFCFYERLDAVCLSFAGALLVQSRAHRWIAVAPMCTARRPLLFRSSSIKATTAQLLELTLPRDAPARRSVKRATTVKAASNTHAQSAHGRPLDGRRACFVMRATMALEAAPSTHAMGNARLATGLRVARSLVPHYLHADSFRM
jgi:hypothetical protein